jgi:hypothetical protein
MDVPLIQLFKFLITIFHYRMDPPQTSSVFLHVIQYYAAFFSKHDPQPRDLGRGRIVRNLRVRTGRVPIRPERGFCGGLTIEGRFAWDNFGGAHGFVVSSII